MKNSSPAVPVDRSEVVALMQDGLESVRDAAQFLGLSVAKVYLLMDQGEIAYAKFGKSRRIPHRCLLEFAARSLIAPAEEQTPT